MASTTGIVLFDGVEELDFVGPWEVLSLACRHADQVITVAQDARPIRANLGLRVLPDHTFADAPHLDVVLIPGGNGTRREVDNPVLIDWIASVAPGCRWVTSVCTGAFLLHAAGLLSGRQATTHWASIDRLREEGGVEVHDDQRFVVDGNVVTAAGISAGIDMALWLVGQMETPEFARDIQRRMEYEPEPPYAPTGAT
jgi:transcriptional regulator GlxA family with amidase domain